MMRHLDMLEVDDFVIGGNRKAFRNSFKREKAVSKSRESH